MLTIKIIQLSLNSDMAETKDWEKLARTKKQTKKNQCHLALILDHCLMKALYKKFLAMKSSNNDEIREGQVSFTPFILEIQ